MLFTRIYTKVANKLSAILCPTHRNLSHEQDGVYIVLYDPDGTGEVVDIGVSYSTCPVVKYTFNSPTDCNIRPGFDLVRRRNA